MATAMNSSRPIIWTTGMGVARCPPAGPDQHDGPLGGGDGRATGGFAGDERGAADRGDQHLAQGAELAIPHDRHPKNIAVMTTLMATTPGWTNWRKLNPPVVPSRPPWLGTAAGRWGSWLRYAG